MKTNIFLAVLLLFVSHANYAQVNRISNDSLAVIRTKTISIICSLDSVQYAKVLQLSRQFLTKSESAFFSKQQTEQKENKVADAKKWWLNQLQEVLTKKQYDLFKKEEKKKEEAWEKEMIKQNIKYQKVKDTNG
jgi:hypothetical protein